MRQIIQDRAEVVAELMEIQAAVAAVESWFYDGILYKVKYEIMAKYNGNT
jgi:hypothetical protein